MKSKFERRVLRRGGQYIAAFRPDDPHNSLNAAKRAVNAQDYSEITDVAEAEPLTFVGWLNCDSDPERLIDIEGNNCGMMQAGDHMLGFKHPDDAKKMIEHYAEMRRKKEST